VTVKIVDGKLTCNDCKKLMPVGDFHVNRARKCGYDSRCRTCKAGRKAAWRLENLDHVADYQTAWRARNAERLKRYDVDRYWADPETHRARVRERMATLEGRGKRALWQQQRRARAIGIVNDLTDGQWRALLDEYGQRCLACGRSDRPLTRDHIVPLTSGGALTLSNVQPLCSPCNASKKTRIIDYRPVVELAREN